MTYHRPAQALTGCRWKAAVVVLFWSGQPLGGVWSLY